MQPITRETYIYDRRQPMLRWSAVIAGTIVGIGVWVLLQLIGTGLGLAALDFNDTARLRHVGIGASVWTLVAPLVAMFVGGMIAGLLSHTRRARGGALHGFVMWALTSIGGGLASLWIVAALAGAPHENRVFDDQTADANTRAQEAGAALLAAGASILLSLGTAIAGSAIGARDPRRRRHDTSPMGMPVVPPADVPVTTAATPVVPVTPVTPVAPAP